MKTEDIEEIKKIYEEYQKQAEELIKQMKKRRIKIEEILNEGCEYMNKKR